jgi:3-hydroxyacyl-CoA dehydrogenase
MSEFVRVETAGDVAVIVIENPPVNAFAAPVRAACWRRSSVSMRTTRCVPSCCTASDATSWPARICASSSVHPWRPCSWVLRRVEACSKPVVAALHGATLGGGAECALASHYRCASRDLQFGLPEVKVGLLPGAGGTVRLPRLVGVKQALDMMTSGDPIGLARAIELGIVDKAVGDDIRSEAIAWAAELAATGAPVRRLRDASIPDASAATPAWFAQYRETMPRAARKLPAPERIVQCVEAAVNLPFDAAMGKARELFEPCRTSAESRSLRHLFFAERGVRPCRVRSGRWAASA